MIRSAAKAIDCRPEEQKRLMVTAEALTGSPARRLAMRATFSPCSASGMAQPRITSSISARSTAAARRSTASITVAAMSSGRVVLSVPEGALPVAVRAAETMTASFMCVSTGEVAEQVFERFAHFLRFAVEQVVGAVYQDKFFWLLEPAVEGPHALNGADLVGLALDEELRLGARQRVGEGVGHAGDGSGHRRRDADQRADAVVHGAGFERDPGAERKPRRPQWKARVARRHVVHRRAKVLE